MVWLALRRHAPILIAAAIALLSVAGLVARPGAEREPGRVDYVIIAGVPGLRWEDVSPTRTPALWRLAERGAIGALAVRSAARVTCPADGWLTLGAGNLAQRGSGSVYGACPADTYRVESPDGIGGLLTDQPTVVNRNQRLTWGARPGALAESVRCTTAIGPGAAVAAARPIGRVDRYVPAIPGDPAGLLSQCVLTIADLGTVGGSGAKRAEAVSKADAAAARLLAARPANSLVIVAGLADTDQVSRLHVAIADGPGFGGGWLASSSTGRSAYLQLIDLAPTALAALDRTQSRLFAGTPTDRVDGRPDALTDAVASLADADREAAAQRAVASIFFTSLVLAHLALLVIAIPLLRRARRPIGAHEPRPVPPALRKVAELLLVAAGLAIPAALVADAVPWWRTAAPAWTFAGVVSAVLALATAIASVPVLRRYTLGPTAAAAAIAAVVVAVDVFNGARLQLNGVAGYSALDGGRYAGIGTIGLGALMAGVLLTAACLAHRVPRRWRPVVVAALGGIGVIVVGNPNLGSDAAGAIALVAGVCIAAAMATGGWLTVGRVAMATVAVIAVTAGFAALELRRPEDERGSLGRFLTAVSDGDAGLMVNRAGSANAVAVANSPLTLLALLTAVFVFFALLQPWGGLKRVFGIYPAVRGAIGGLIVASLLGGALNGVGLNVAGAAAATALPLAILSALRVLAHADERTVVPRPPEDAPVSPRPVITAPMAEPARNATTRALGSTPPADGVLT